MCVTILAIGNHLQNTADTQYMYGHNQASVLFLRNPTEDYIGTKISCIQMITFIGLNALLCGIAYRKQLYKLLSLDLYRAG